MKSIHPASATAVLTLLLAPAPAHAASVLVLSNQYEAEVVDDFTANTVGHTYTGFNVSGQTPTVAMMNQFDAVLVFEDGLFGNAVSVGDAVAAYYAQGQRCVVIGTFYWQERSDNPIYSAPGWGALEGIDVFTGLAGGSEYAPDSLDPGSIVAHPITQGVTMLSAGAYRGGIEPKPDTTILATWLGTNTLDKADPLIGIREDPNGGRFVGISILPSYEAVGDYGADFTGDFHILWQNAFSWCGSPCGNGAVTGDEQCDDGNNVDGDGCTALCDLEVCGDGVDNNNDAEDCDDGNDDDTDTCVQGCALATCGDGFLQDGVEGCDDGNQIDDDMCSNACALPSCGDNIKQAAEECDDANPDNTDMCLDTCVSASCGDGFIHAGVEGCDDANEVNTDACLDTCQPASCGDGFVHDGVEPCDDGNADDSDSCVAGCAVASCGDGFVFAGIEDCDDANAIDDDECANDCTLPGETTTMTGGASDPETTGDDTTGAVDPSTSTGEDPGTSGGDLPTTSGTGGSDSNSGGVDTTGDTPTSGTPPGDTSTGDGSTSGSGSDTVGVDDEGCGCATSPAQGLRGGLLGLLAFTLLGRRRRR